MGAREHPAAVIFLTGALRAAYALHAPSARWLLLLGVVPHDRGEPVGRDVEGEADLAARIEGRQVGGDTGVDRGRAAPESSCEQAAVQRAEAENAARLG